MRPLSTNWFDSGITDALRRLGLLLRKSQQPSPSWLSSGTLEEAAATFSPPSLKAAAAHRVCYGAELEAVAVAAATKLCSTNRANLNPNPNPNHNPNHNNKRTDLGGAQVGEAPNVLVAQRQCSEACQLYFDAYAAAVWTSAHAEYIASIEDGVLEPPPPSIATFPCASGGFDLGDHFERRVATKGEALPKEAEPLVSLLARATNPGQRGWDSVLKVTLEHEGIRSIVSHSVLVCLTGMHPQLHPAMRRPWRERMHVLRAAKHALADNEEVFKSALYVKEAVRRCLASTMRASAATHAALSAVGHPVRHLHQPPFQFPHRGMEGSMCAFAKAGVLLPTSGLVAALEAGFKEREVDQATVDSSGLGGFAWYSSWLGTLQ